VIPQGVEFKLKTDDPAFTHFRKFAVEAGLKRPQTAVLTHSYEPTQVAAMAAFAKSSRRE
jgi:hypothetical protein